jgi:hypothetical protein
MNDSLVFREFLTPNTGVTAKMLTMPLDTAKKHLQVRLAAPSSTDLLLIRNSTGAGSM